MPYKWIKSAHARNASQWPMRPFLHPKLLQPWSPPRIKGARCRLLHFRAHGFEPQNLPAESLPVHSTPEENTSTSPATTLVQHDSPGSPLSTDIPSSDGGDGFDLPSAPPSDTQEQMSPSELAQDGEQVDPHIKNSPSIGHQKSSSELPNNRETEHSKTSLIVSLIPSFRGSDGAGNETLSEDWADLTSDKDYSEEMWADWTMRCPEERIRTWPYMMRSTMIRSPHWIIKALQLSCTFPEISRNHIVEALEFSARSYLERKCWVGLQTFDGLLNVIGSVTRSLKEVKLHDSIVWLAFLISNKVQAKELYYMLEHQLVSSGPLAVRPETRYPIFYGLASFALVDEAMSVLRGLSISEGLISCTILQLGIRKLYKASRDRNPGDYPQLVQLLEELFILGATPDEFLFTTTIKDAIEANDSHSAFGIYNMIKRYNLTPSTITFSVLLNHAKRRRDWEAIDFLVLQIEEHGILADEHILGDLLHVTELRASAAQDPYLMEEVLLQYQQSFSMDAVHELGLTSDAPEEASSSSKPTPSYITLTIVICAYLKHNHHDWTKLAAIYGRYRACVAENRENESPFPIDDYVPNAFLVAFARAYSTLHLCPLILKDMLDPSTGLNPPTVHTWNIVLTAYLKHDQEKAAERILELMHEHGGEPDQYTWLTLLIYYYRTSNTRARDEVFDHMLRALGEDWEFPASHRWLVRHLQRIRSPENTAQEPPPLDGALDRKAKEQEERLETMWQTSDPDLFYQLVPHAAEDNSYLSVSANESAAVKESLD